MADSKRILITGAGSGFGLGAAGLLAADGHRVIAGVIDDAQAAEVRAVDERIAVQVLDVTDPASVAAAADIEIDVLVNNAGRGQLGPLADIPLDLVRQVFEVNVFGTVAVTQAVVPGMKERGGGRIITVSSIAGIFSGPLSGPYAMTKHALEAFCSSLRAELEPYGIEVVKLNPGPYATGFNDAMVDGVDTMLAPAGGSVEKGLASNTRTRMLGNQHDPADLIATMAHLCVADDVPYETFKPDDVLERYGLRR